MYSWSRTPTRRTETPESDDVLRPPGHLGVEIQPLRTVDGDRTNITYYSDVSVHDKYRIGEVNGGWTVLREALNDEHGTVERGADGLEKVAAMTEHPLLLAEATDKVAAAGRLTMNR